VPSHSFIAAVVTLCLVGATAACSRAAPRANTVSTVKLQNFVFIPAELTVARGDTVVWSNTDFVPHSATARDSAWDSKAIESNGSWRWAAREPGRHDYYCVFHPNMKGTIVVR
jgi:plastocyanin